MARGEYARQRALRNVAAALVLGTLCGYNPVAASSYAASDTNVTLRTAGVEFAFVRIPAGRFLMGSDTGPGDERPAHEVVIPHDFHLMRTEVTVRQFAAFVEATGYQTDAERSNWAWLCPAADLAGPDRGLNWRTPGLEQSEDDPAVVLTRNDAVAFCRWLGAQTARSVRLPTEAEWEYAARGGADAADLGEHAWYDADADGRTHPVAQKRPNAWGLYDMAGNAWEWCLDVWHPTYDNAPADGGARRSDPDIPEVGWRYVLRGGCWASPSSQLRPAYRYRGTENFRNCGTGFRAVLGTDGRGETPPAGTVSAAVRSSRTGGEPGLSVRIAARPNGTRLCTGALEFDLIRVPAGRFIMGSDVHGEEEPMHEVTIGYDFEIGRTEVTRGQFRAFIEATGYITEAEKEGWGWTRSDWRDWHPELDISWRNPGFSQTDDHPATCVSWYDAMAFCRWLSRETGQTIRLPSGAEWEYACCAGTTGHYAGDVAAMGWYRYNSGQRTHPVAQKQPNAWGLYDMHGNVWEWCRDMWHYGYHGAPTDGSAWVEAGFFIPLMRGGSFTNPAWWLRSANHMRNDPGCRHSYNQGFRIVRDLRPPKARPVVTASQFDATRQTGAPAALVPVKTELPQKQFIGTPKDIRAPRIKPVQTKVGPPFLAPPGTRNVALGKPVSSSDTEPVIGELEMITDGDKEAGDGSFVELGPLLQQVSIDLQGDYEIYAVRLWHYHQEPRVYFDVIVHISDDPDFGAGVKTIFNNDMDNSSGLGTGRDMHYVDTHFGELFDAKGICGRYVRLYSNGSTADDLNHYVEVEVYGRPAPRGSEHSN
ncbi:MAG: SUMF1/EgtB/PvdO family nonheme iron enzyme [Sedimentisphaerales bacterium]|nr:SUMF1/EgtB/PvdO family nonheme iron enzyme [Sedimentisphaerales bacterium]